jgi:hypothetical protein
LEIDAELHGADQRRCVEEEGRYVGEVVPDFGVHLRAGGDVGDGVGAEECSGVEEADGFAVGF